MTPRELVTAAQQGDRDAFAQLWRLYHDEVMAVIYRRTHNRHTAEDLTSEVFLRAWRRLPTFTWQGNGFAGWLTVIALNVTVDHFKAAHRRLSRHFPGGDFEAWPAASTDRRTDPHQAVEQADLAQAIDRAIAQLTPAQRQAIALRYGAGLRSAEAGEFMGCTRNAFNSTLFRAARALAANPDLAALAVAA